MNHRSQSYLVRVIAEEEDLISSRVGDGAQFSVAGVDVVAEDVDVAAGNDVLGGHVLSEAVEDVDLLRIGRVDVEHAQLVGVRKDGSDGADAVVGLVAHVQHSVRCHRDGRYRIEPVTIN